MNTLKIQKVQEVIGTDQANKAAPFYLVTFMVGEHGPFTERFAKAGFDSGAARQQLEAFARGIEKLTS